MALQWQFTDNFMGYVSYAEGFNSGGVSAPTVGTTRLILPYEPSTLENFEFGIRSDLLDGRLRFNATVFDTALGRPPGRGRRQRSGHGRADPDARYDERRRGGKPRVSSSSSRSCRPRTCMVNVGVGMLDTEYTDIKPGTMTGHLPLNVGHGVRASAGFELHARLPAHREPDSGGSWVSRLDYNYQGQFWRSEPFLRVDGLRRRCRMATRRAATGAS